MAWVSDDKIRRTYDPESGLELFSISSSSSLRSKFKIEGKNTLIYFTTSMVEAPITEIERKNLEISDAIVWLIRGGEQIDEWKKPIIAEAMIAYQMGFGFNPRGTKTFVRFGQKADLYH